MRIERGRIEERELRNGREIEVKVALTTHLKSQFSTLQSSPSPLKPQISNLSPRKERTHGYKNTSSGSQEVLDAC